MKAILRFKQEGERENLREAQAKRSKTYGIAVKSDTHLTPPAGYPTNAADYGDPVNYRYPLNPGRLQSARSYFNHSGQRTAGGYTPEEWALIGRRIAARTPGWSFDPKTGKLAMKGTARVRWHLRKAES